jgi:hypothetical protein
MDDARRAAIITLLQTRDDGLPEPRRHAQGSSGFAGGVDEKGRPLRAVSCPDCLANGFTTFACETCHGTGHVADDGKDPMDDPIKNPPYDERRKTNWGGNDRIEDARERDRQLQTLEQQLSPPKSEADLLAEANRRGFGWEEERRRMYRLFDYGALDAALDLLRDADDSAYRAIHAVYVYAWLTELSPGVEVSLERGLLFLSEKLPDNLRSPTTKHPALARRDRRAA